MSAVQSFDAAGRLDSEIKVFEDGRYSLIDYDQAGAGAWALSARTYDVSHRLIEDAIVFDNGASSYAYFDAAAAQPWARQTVTYDAAGLIESLVVQGDRHPWGYGRVQQSHYDRQNVYSWTETHWSIIVQDRLTSSRRETLYDDGSRLIAEYADTDFLSFEHQQRFIAARARSTTGLQAAAIMGFCAPWRGSTTTSRTSSRGRTRRQLDRRTAHTLSVPRSSTTQARHPYRAETGRAALTTSTMTRSGA